ncbi:MAG: hypothetical protein JXA30_22720 [Deltaproteobacteria bacterium]|nr:hypothetical protein [Deltaproteobacteria bacterium]
MENTRKLLRRDESVLDNIVSVQGAKRPAANSPVKPSAPAVPARIVLALPDAPARGRKPGLRDDFAAFVAKQHYPLGGYTISSKRTPS